MLPLSILLTALTWAPPTYALVLAAVAGVEISPGALIFGAAGALLQWSLLRNVGHIDDVGKRVTAIEQTVPTRLAVLETRVSALEKSKAA